MAVMPRSSPFGSRSRTGVLLTLFLLGQSYPREMSRVLGTGLSAVQKALAGLERDGLVAGRTSLGTGSGLSRRSCSVVNTGWAAWVALSG